MKNIILGLIFMTFPFLINAQKTITYEEMKTITKGIFENITCDIYVAKDGKKYRIGDTLKIAQPSSRETYAFITQANKITSAAPPRRVVVGNETELQPLPVSEIVPKYVSPLIVNGMLTIIQKFEVTGSKRRGFTIKVIGKALCVSCPSYFIDFEEALTAGEIQSF
jgi:hypothetical protein